MARVFFPSDFTAFTGGVDQVDIDAPRVRELMLALVDRFPDIALRLTTIAVAIDGDIYSDAEFIPIAATSEIHLVPKIAGG